MNYQTARQRLVRMLPPFLRKNAEIVSTVELVYYIGCTSCQRRLDLNDGVSLEVDRKIEQSANAKHHYVTLLCSACSQTNQ